MNIPDQNAPIWKQIVRNEKQATFSFLGLKFLLVKLQSSPKSDADKAAELHAMILKNANHPKVQADLGSILR